MTLPDGYQAEVELGGSDHFNPQQVRELIASLLGQHHQLIAPYLGQLEGLTGKMIRARLLMTFAGLFRVEDTDSTLTCAACCELLHTATLIHDDVVDQADRRRGLPTARSKLGNEVAVIVGDYVLAVMLRALNRLGDPELNEMLLATSQELGMGVIEEIVNKNNFSLHEEKVIQIIELKTASLFGLCGRMAAHLGRAPLHQQEAAGEYGRNFGIAFQLVDDLLDIVSDPELTGKPIFADLREGRVTLPVLIALEEQGDEVRELILSYQRKPTPEGAARLLEMIVQSGGISRTLKLAERYRRSARRALIRISHRLLTPQWAAQFQAIEDRLYALLPDWVREELYQNPDVVFG